MNRLIMCGPVIAALVLAAGACTAKRTPSARPVIQDYVTEVQVNGAAVKTAVKPNALPAGGAGPAAVDVPGSATVVNGGSLRQAVTAATDFAKLRIAVRALAGGVAAGASGAPGSSAAPPPSTPPDGPPASGYLEVGLGQATRTADLVISLAQTLPASGFVLYYALVDASGKQGSVVRQVVSALAVGTGEVQVSVSWDVDSDVDLHVVDPDEDEVFYRDDKAASGGELDLDSNADCDLDHKRNENITWSKAPPGRYVVRLDYFDHCDMDKTNWVVTVRVVGQPARVFKGEFTGDGDGGGRGDGQEITTFTVDGARASATPSRK